MGENQGFCEMEGVAETDSDSGCDMLRYDSNYMFLDNIL